MNKLAGCILAVLASFSGSPGAASAQQTPPKSAKRPAARTAAAPPTSSGSPAAAAEDADNPSPPTDDPADTPEPVTVIDAYERTTFTSKDRIVVFRGRVKVVDPRFQLVCDELTVFLNKSSQPAPGAAPAPGASPDPKGSSGGIDHAVAKGHVVILQHRAATKAGGEEKISIGRGEEGDFDNKTGDMTLKGTPSIEQNGNTHVANSPGTVMVIHRDGGLDTIGPAQTVLTQRKGGDGIELPGGPNSPGDAAKKGKAPASTARPGPAAGKPQG